MRKSLLVSLLCLVSVGSFAASFPGGPVGGNSPTSVTVVAGSQVTFDSLVTNGADTVHFDVLAPGGATVYSGDSDTDASGHVSFTWFPLYDGTFTVTATGYAGGMPLGTTTTSYVSAVRPDASGFITGGGWVQQGTSRDTFGFVAQVLGNGNIKGNLEFQQHGNGTNVKSTSVDWVYAPNRTHGYFSGLAKVNGSGSYRFFMEVFDLGEPGGNDSVSLWVYDANGALVYHYANGLSGGNVQIHSKN